MKVAGVRWGLGLGAGLGLYILTSCAVPLPEEDPAGSNGGETPEVHIKPTIKLQPIPEGVRWARESSHLLAWKVPDLPKNIEILAKITASFDGGATWQQVENVSAYPDNRYVWVVPASGPPKVRFRVAISDSQVETKDVEFEPSTRRKYRWTKILNEAPWGGRDGVGGLVYNDRMWVLGGWNPLVNRLESTNDVWSSVDGVKWSLEKPNTFGTPAFDGKRDWEGRHWFGTHVHDGQMWIVGGDSRQGYYQTDVWSSTDGKNWTRKDIYKTETHPIYVPSSREVSDNFGFRYLVITGTFNGKLWAMGGETNATFVDPLWPGIKSAVFNDVWSSKDGANWTKVQTRGPIWEPRGMISESPAFKGRMWVVGGGTYDDVVSGRPHRNYYADTWSTADGAEWRKEPEIAPFSTRSYHSTAVFDERLWVIAGADIDGNLADAWYTSDGRNWYEAVPPTDFAGRHAHNVWAYKGALYVGLGNEFDEDPKRGANEPPKWLSDIWRIDVVP